MSHSGFKWLKAATVVERRASRGGVLISESRGQQGQAMPAFGALPKVSSLSQKKGKPLENVQVCGGGGGREGRESPNQTCIVETAKGKKEALEGGQREAGRAVRLPQWLRM